MPYGPRNNLAMCVARAQTEIIGSYWSGDSERSISGSQAPSGESAHMSATVRFHNTFRGRGVSYSLAILAPGGNWGSRGRRFKSGQPDGNRMESGSLSFSGAETPAA